MSSTSYFPCSIAAFYGPRSFHFICLDLSRDAPGCALQPLLALNFFNILSEILRSQSRPCFVLGIIFFSSHSQHHDSCWRACLVNPNLSIEAKTHRLMRYPMDHLRQTTPVLRCSTQDPSRRSKVCSCCKVHTKCMQAEQRPGFSRSQFTFVLILQVVRQHSMASCQPSWTFR